MSTRERVLWIIAGIAIVIIAAVNGVGSAISSKFETIKSSLGG